MEEPRIRTSHVVSVMVLIVSLFLIAYLAPHKSPQNLPNFDRLSYYTAIVTYNLTPYVVKNCITLSDSEKADYIIEKDIDSISVSDSFKSECSVYSKSLIEYFLMCVQKTNGGVKDNCGVISSETRKKLSGTNNTFS